MTILAGAPGLTPVEIEGLVSRPIELAIASALASKNNEALLQVRALREGTGDFSYAVCSFDVPYLPRLFSRISRCSGGGNGRTQRSGPSSLCSGGDWVYRSFRYRRPKWSRSDQRFRIRTSTRHEHLRGRSLFSPFPHAAGLDDRTRRCSWFFTHGARYWGRRGSSKAFSNGGDWRFDHFNNPNSCASPFHFPLGPRAFCQEHTADVMSFSRVQTPRRMP